MVHMIVKQDMKYSLLTSSGEKGETLKVRIFCSGGFQTLSARSLFKRQEAIKVTSDRERHSRSHFILLCTGGVDRVARYGAQRE